MPAPSHIPGASAALIAALDALDSYLANSRDLTARGLMLRSFFKVPAPEARACAAAIIASESACAGECLALSLCLNVVALVDGVSRDRVLAEIGGAA